MSDILDKKLTDEQKIIIKECMQSIKNYNQAAVLLSMGGGKSVIAANIIKNLKKNKEKYNVIWITTASDIGKAQAIMNIDYLKESLTYVSFTTLSRNEDYVNDLVKLHDKYDLIVIDEAHHSLAFHTYQGLKNILEQFSSAKLLVMTATKRRYSDRKQIFEWLTPKLTLGVDYQDRGLKYSIDNNLICDFTYKTCNIAKLRQYSNALELMKQYSEIYRNFDELLQHSANVIDDYNKNVFSKLGDQLAQDMEFDGSQGDRWFVFYNWIDELKDGKDSIENMFRLAYRNTNVSINIIEYHSLSTDDKAIDKIMAAPVPNQVDIILTCNKGAESLHPENTRGIIILRNTKSGTVFEQMLGRALEIKERCSSTKYIYDLVDTRDSVMKGQSIYNGSETPDERRISSLLNKIDINNDIIDKLQSKYGENSFDIEVMDSEVDVLLEQFGNVKQLFDNLLIAKTINNILKAELGDNYKYSIISKKDASFKIRQALDKYKKDYYSLFRNIQRMFISGYFGEPSSNNSSGKTPAIYNEIFELFGNILYLVPESTENCDFNLAKMVSIADEVKMYDYDYRNRISKTKELKANIAILRTLNLNRKLSESYQKFCIRNRIDISGEHVNIITEVRESPDVVKYPNALKEFNNTVRYLTKADIQMEGIKYSIDIIKNNSEYTDVLLTAIAKEQVFAISNPNSSIGIQGATAINIRFKKMLKLAKSFISREEYNNATNIIKAISRINRFRDESDERILNIFSNIEHEFPIIDLVKRNENNEVSEYELYVLEELGIRVIDNANRNANIRKLIDRVPFGIIYNRFVANPNKDDYTRLTRYKKDGLPKYAQKMLNTTSFKKSVTSVTDEILFEKDNESIRDKVSKLLYVDDRIICDIKKAVDNKEVDARKIIIYALPLKSYQYAKKDYDMALKRPWESLDKRSIDNIRNSLSNASSCYDVIIENLMDNGLIPMEQSELAKALIEIAQ